MSLASVECHHKAKAMLHSDVFRIRLLLCDHTRSKEARLTRSRGFQRNTADHGMAYSPIEFLQSPDRQKFYIFVQEKNNIFHVFFFFFFFLIIQLQINIIMSYMSTVLRNHSSVPRSGEIFGALPMDSCQCGRRHHHCYTVPS